MIYDGSRSSCCLLLLLLTVIVFSSLDIQTSPQSSQAGASSASASDSDSILMALPTMVKTCTFVKVFYLNLRILNAIKLKL